MNRCVDRVLASIYRCVKHRTTNERANNTNEHSGIKPNVVSDACVLIKMARREDD